MYVRKRHSKRKTQPRKTRLKGRHILPSEDLRFQRRSYPRPASIETFLMRSVGCKGVTIGLQLPQNSSQNLWSSGWMAQRVYGLSIIILANIPQVVLARIAERMGGTGSGA